MNTVTLIDGREVSSDSPEWKEECLMRDRHLSHLKRTPGSADRRIYIETVERIEGKEAANRLKAKFTEWWGHK